MVELQESDQAKQKTTNWFVFSLVVAAVVLGAAYLFKWLTPTQIQQQPTLNRNYQGTTTNFSKVTFTGLAPALPSELPVAIAENFTPLDFEDRTVKNALIKRFDLQRHPAIETLWVSTTYSLQEIEATGSYELTSLVNIPQEKIIDSIEVIKSGQDFVNSLFPNNNLQLLENYIVYKEADAHGDVVEASEAGLVELPFGYQIEGYPIFLEKSLEYPVQVLMNADNQVQKAVFRPFFVSPKVEGKIKALTLAEAIANINDNKATIISSFYKGFEAESLETIVSGALNEVSIEYRISTDTQQIVPYYRFAGQLTNAEGKQFSAEIITTAVQTQAN